MRLNYVEIFFHHRQKYIKKKFTGEEKKEKNVEKIGKVFFFLPLTSLECFYILFVWLFFSAVFSCFSSNEFWIFSLPLSSSRLQNRLSVVFVETSIICHWYVLVLLHLKVRLITVKNLSVIYGTKWKLCTLWFGADMKARCGNGTKKN